MKNITKDRQTECTCINNIGIRLFITYRGSFKLPHRRKLLSIKLLLGIVIENHLYEVQGKNTIAKYFLYFFRHSNSHELLNHYLHHIALPTVFDDTLSYTTFLARTTLQDQFLANQ